jgi:lipocalin-like protein
MTLRLTTFALGLMMLSAPASGQDKPLAQQLLGAWTLVASYQERPDGTRFDTFGPDPKGLMIFDQSGRMSLQMARSDRPKFSSNNRLTGTPEENKAAVQGLLSYFGRYEVNEGERAVVITVDASSFPNQDGTTQKRPVEITGDELRWTNPVPSRGEFSAAYIIWQRTR